MKLPLADEIREIRRRVIDSQDATLHVARVRAALASLDVLERHAGQRPELGRDLPGEEALREVAERWPQLADLPSSDPSSGAPPAERLAARRAQLQLARQTLLPLANDIGTLSHEMQRLQHLQQHHLESPQYADLAREIAELSAERDRLSHQTQPLQQRQGVLDPTLRTLDNFLQRIDEAVAATRAEEDPRGLLAWRTAFLVDTLVRSLDSLLREVDLEVPFPEPIGAGPEPDPQAAPALWSAIEHTRSVLGELSIALRTLCDEIDREVEVKVREAHRINALMLERMG